MDLDNNTDALGFALLSFMEGERNFDVTIISDISDDDVIPVNYLFRTEKDFPDLEKKAIALCKGKLLDVGAGSGCHSLVLKNKGLTVQSIDISKGAVDVMLQQQLNAEQLNFFDVSEKYDTLLFLMNGIGISGTLDGLKPFLNHAKSLLKPNGQLLLDSSDISYMFEDEDGAIWTDLNKSYYGEVVYQMKYKDAITKPFNWLFVDFETLKKQAMDIGFNVDLILEDDNNQYLAKLYL